MSEDLQTHLSITLVQSQNHILTKKPTLLNHVSQNPHSHIARSGTGSRRINKDKTCEMKTNSLVDEEDSSSIELSLELGRGSGKRVVERVEGHIGFTILQFQELQLQSLIFKYIQSGLPIPKHLILPIWKSVAASLRGLNDGLHPYVFNSLGISSMFMDSSKRMDSEPWRCRRTDGKKWRCRKEAVKDHNYCDRHMNRGRRHRSQKLVDAYLKKIPTTNGT